MNTNIIWQDFEFEHSHKTPDWFWSIWIITIGVMIFLLIKGNVILPLPIFMSAFTISIQATNKPKIITFEINETGIITGQAKYPYKNLDSFWITKDEKPRLIIKIKNSFMTHAVISLKNTNKEAVESFLLNHLKKEEQKEPLSHKIAKYL